MKKKSIGMIILRNFLKTLGVMLLFVVVGVLSYYLTMLYYNKTGRTERSTQYTHAITVNTGNESSNPMSTSMVSCRIKIPYSYATSPVKYSFISDSFATCGNFWLTLIRSL